MKIKLNSDTNELEAHTMIIDSDGFELQIVEGHDRIDIYCNNNAPETLMIKPMAANHIALISLNVLVKK